MNATVEEPLAEDRFDERHIPNLYSLRRAISHGDQNYWIRRLANQLPSVITSTAGSVYPRTRHFNLTNPSFSGGSEEANWESWCLTRWSIRHGYQKRLKPVPHGWHRIVSRQVPMEPPPCCIRHLLTADLVGISEDGYPVVVEVKANVKQIPLLSTVLQALDYGIRLQVSWRYFLPEWKEIVTKYGGQPFKSELDRVYLVCAAPAGYWRHELSPKIGVDVHALTTLLGVFSSVGFPVSFIRLHKTTVNKVGFRVVAQPINFLRASTGANLPFS